MQLDKEAARFRELREELLEAGHGGRWVLIHGDDLVGTFDTKDEALDAGFARFREAFLVKEVRAEDRVYMMSSLLTPREVTAHVEVDYDSSDDLVVYGPRLGLKVRPSQRYSSEGDPAPVVFIWRNAVIDTGAHMTTLDPAVLAEIGSRFFFPVGQETFQLANGVKVEANIYRAELRLAYKASEVDLGEMEVAAVSLETGALEQCLIGRDALAKGVLTYDGPRGSIRFEVT